MKSILNFVNIKIDNRWLIKGKEEVLSSKYLKWFVLILVLLSVGFWVFYYNQDLTLSYNDARSRLNIARRVLDGLNTGFAQVGSVWLPLFHVLELPLVWNYSLWQSGIAGSVISMISYVLGGIYLLKFTQKLEFSKTVSIFSILIYALNPNMLFMQALPMTESMLIFLSIASCYYLYSWSISNRFEELIFGAFFVFLSTLTRYDGWFLLMFTTLYVAVVNYRKQKKIKNTFGHLFLFGTLAAFGVLLWFGWNQLIFGDPFYFIFGPFSAKSQQDVLSIEGRLFSKGSLVYSTFLYLITVLYNMGIWIGLVSFFGLFLLLGNSKHDLNKKLIFAVLSVPFVFNVLSLYAGHSVIHLPYIEPYAWFNDRYGLMMLPMVAIAFAYVAAKNRLTVILSVLIILFQNIYMYAGNNIITIEDGIRGSSGSFLYAAGEWVGNNAKDGLILVAASSHDALIFTSGLPLKRFIVEGSGKYWEDSLADPTRHAKWVIMKEGDLVEKKFQENKYFLNNYTLVYKDSFSYIYVLDEQRSTPLDENELP